MQTKDIAESTTTIQPSKQNLNSLRTTNLHHLTQHKYPTWNTDQNHINKRKRKTISKYHPWKITVKQKP